MNSSSSPAIIPNSFRWGTLAVGILAAILAVVGLLTSGASQFFPSYLFAFMFWVGLSGGCLVLVMMYFVAGGKWARMIQGITSAGARTMWLLLILFIPIPFGLKYLYPWAQPERVAANEVLQHQSGYLNPTFFVIRAVIFIAIWIVLAIIITRQAVLDDALTNRTRFYRLRTLSTIGLILYFLTMSFASVDWILSLQEGWYSSIFGLIVILSQGLISLSFAILILRLLLWPRYLEAHAGTEDQQTNRDLGAILLAFTMGWAYLSFFQFLIIWAGNISHEVAWYAIRLNNGWQVLALIMVIAQFALPFFALISMQTRSKLNILAGISALVFLVNLVTLFWQVAPSIYPNGVHVHWLDFILPIAMGGLWLFFFSSQLKALPAIPTLPKPVVGEPAQEAHP